MKKCLFIIAVLISCQLFSQDPYSLSDQNDACRTGYSKQGSGTMRFNSLTGQYEPISVQCVKDGINIPIAEAVVAKN